MTATVSPEEPLNGTLVTFTATGTAGTSAQFAVSNGNGQSANTVGASVTTPPAVIVRYANNNPVSGVNVDYTITGGGGQNHTTGGLVGGPLTVATNGSGRHCSAHGVAAGDDSGRQYVDRRGDGSAREPADVYGDGQRGRCHSHRDLVEQPSDCCGRHRSDHGALRVGDGRQ